MCTILELSGLFVCLGDLLSFTVPGGQKKGTSTQADTMKVHAIFNYYILLIKK